MNITPTLLNPLQTPAQQERKAIAGVQAPARARDAADEADPRAPTRRVIDEARRAHLVARVEAMATPHTGHSARVNRALASYGQVAVDNERDTLRDMLGFDDYA